MTIFANCRNWLRRAARNQIRKSPIFVNLSRPQTNVRDSQFSAVPLLVPFIVAAALTACATPATRTVTQEVRVPVATQPLKPEQVPTPPAPLGPRPQSLSAAADVLLAAHCEFVAYVLKADPLLRISAGLPPKELPPFPECEGARP